MKEEAYPFFRKFVMKLYFSRRPLYNIGNINAGIYAALGTLALHWQHAAVHKVSKDDT